MTSSNANALSAVDSFITDFGDFNDSPVFSKAISDIEEAYYIKILPAEPAVKTIYFQNAVSIWEKVLTKFPDYFYNSPDLYYFIGDCYRHLGEYEKAIQSYNIVAANWADNGCATESHAVVPLPDESPGYYEAFHGLVDGLIVDFGDDPGLAATILRTGYEYRRRANRFEKQGLSEDAEADNFKAVVLYDRVIKEFSPCAFTAGAYFFSALSYQDLGQWQESLNYCNYLLDNWPEYKYAAWAQRLAEDCSERLAAQAQ